jgi:hypothetical protein
MLNIRIYISLFIFVLLFLPAAYRFLAKHLGMNLSAVTRADGVTDESKSILEDLEMFLVFSSKNPFPANALKGRDAIGRELAKLQH